jgi:hypothetical protein
VELMDLKLINKNSEIHGADSRFSEVLLKREEKGDEPNGLFNT